MTRSFINVVRRTNPRTGSAEVGVKLANHPDRAWTSAHAYARIVERFGNVPWFMNDNGKGRFYVRLVPRDAGQPVMVSRLITGEKPRKVIRYQDGDRLNLRPENLVVCSGWVKAKVEGNDKAQKAAA